MQEELRIFLVDNASPEVYDLMVKAFDIFEDMYPVDIHNKYLELVVTQDESDRDTGDTLALVINLTRYYLNRILEDHLLVVNDEINLTNLIIIVEALLDVQSHEDTDTVLNILNLDIDNEEKIAEILSLVAPLDQSEILLEIESVSESLLIKIKEFITVESIVTSTDINVVIQDYLDEIKLFEEFTGNTGLISIGMIKSDVDPGYLFSVYANIIGRDLEAISIDQAAEELVSMALISSDGYSNPKLVISKNIENYISDMRKITQLDIKITDLLIKFQGFKDKKKLVPKDV